MYPPDVWGCIMMIDALEGEDGAFASRRNGSAATSAATCEVPDAVEAASESDDFEGRRNWASLLIIAAVLVAMAAMVPGAVYGFSDKFS